MKVLEITELYKKFDSFYAVKDFNLTVSSGEFISFLGPSGCGKTTTLRMIAGFIEATEGNIVINNKIVFGDGINLPPEHRHIGMVFQSYAVWPHMTVYNNVAYPLKIKKFSKDKIKENVINTLKLMNLEDHVDKYPGQLSGGQQQRVALARALVMEPDVLLLDEPLSNLDAKLRNRMREEIKILQKRTGVTIIFVTHDQVEALSMSDRIVVMNHGEIQQIGTPNEIYEHPVNEFVADFIGKANFIKGYIDNNKLVIEGLNMQKTLINTTNLTQKSEINICYRPEQITISKEKMDTNNQVTGKVKIINYLGNLVEYTVLVGKESIVVETFEKAKINVDDSVWLSLPEPIIFMSEGASVV